MERRYYIFGEFEDRNEWFLEGNHLGYPDLTEAHNAAVDMIGDILERCIIVSLTAGHNHAGRAWLLDDCCTEDFFTFYRFRNGYVDRWWSWIMPDLEIIQRIEQIIP